MRRRHRNRQALDPLFGIFTIFGFENVRLVAGEDLEGFWDAATRTTHFDAPDLIDLDRSSVLVQLGFSVGQVGTRQCEISRPPASENEPFVLFLFQLAFHEGVVLLHKPWRSLRVITQKAVPLLSRPVEFEYVEEPILLQLVH